MTANETVSSVSIGYTPISKGLFSASKPRRCQRTTSSEYATNFRLGQSEHFHPFNKPQTPRPHWFSQYGEYPFFPVFALSNRRAKAFFRPTNIERKNATFSEFDEY
jgi:hypothetical protein